MATKKKKEAITDDEKKLAEGLLQQIADKDAGVVRIELPEIKETDIGEYCVDCRREVTEDTEWFASRQPVVRDSENGTERLKGFLCDDCQPLEGTLMEPIIKALVQRRFDEKEIRTHMKRVGPETLFEELVAPMLDMLEILLQLERK